MGCMICIIFRPNNPTGPWKHPALSFSPVQVPSSIGVVLGLTTIEPSRLGRKRMANSWLAASWWLQNCWFLGSNQCSPTLPSSHFLSAKATSSEVKDAYAAFARAATLVTVACHGNGMLCFSQCRKMSQDVTPLGSSPTLAAPLWVRMAHQISATAARNGRASELPKGRSQIEKWPTPYFFGDRTNVQNHGTSWYLGVLIPPSIHITIQQYTFSTQFHCLLAVLPDWIGHSVGGILFSTISFLACWHWRCSIFGILCLKSGTATVNHVSYYCAIQLFFTLLCEWIQKNVHF